ncbi:hypothetical protein [Nocardioides ultimimeridianus]
MSITSRKTHVRGDAPADWQPIGLATPVTILSPKDGRTLVHDLAVARARRAARSVIAPGVVLAATLGVTSYAAATGAMPTVTTSASTTGTPTSSTTTTSTGMSTGTTATTPGVPMPTSAAGGLSGLSGIGGSLPGANLPVVGKFVANAPSIFSAGLLGGTPAVQTSVDPHQTGHSTGDTTAPGGGDMCDFFLQHMWKNEDGIPVLGSNSHFLTYHTDPAYKNLILSLFSGAIGNSEMPIVNIYQGPLGWIPIFNPTHVRGHGTDYVTLLTGCGGMGLPIDTKTGSINLDRLPTPAKALNLATRIMPNVPSLPKMLGPDYLYNTLRVDEITNRLGFNTVMTPDEYVAFAGKNIDAMRLLWQTALEKMSNPVSILDVLKVTDNIKTFQSLGLPGLPGVPGAGGSTLTGSLPSGGLTAGLPTAGLTNSLPTSSVPVVGQLLADALGGKATPPAGEGIPGTSTSVDTGSTTPGSTTPGSTTPGSTTPGSTTPGSTTPGSTTPGTSDTGSLPLGDLTSSIPLLGGGAQAGGLVPSGGLDLLSSIPVLGGSLSGVAGTPSGTGTTPGSTTPGSTTPGSTTPGSTTPGSTTPGSTTPGSTTPGSTTPGSTTPGSTTPGSTTPGSTTPGSTTPGSTTPGSTTPGSTTPGSTTPGSTTPGSTTPGSTTPGSTTPGSTAPSGSLPGLDVLGQIPVVGGILSGSATSGSTTPGSTTPGSTTPGSTTPGSTTPGSTTPGSTTPGSTTPGSTTPGSTTPGSNQQSTVAFTVGKPTVNGAGSGLMVTKGSSVTFKVPVTNTGTLPLTRLSGTTSDGTTMVAPAGALQPGRTAYLTYTVPAQTGMHAVGFNIVGSNANGQQMAKTCGASYTGVAPTAGQVVAGNGVTVNNQPVSSGVRYTFGSTSPAKVGFQVTNTGDAPIRTLTATSPNGHVTCAKTSLQPGESTTCSVSISPQSGLNQVKVDFAGVDVNGRTTTSTKSMDYTLCTCGDVPSTPVG